MTHPDGARAGAACWADLSTSDVDGSRAFYAAVLGWTAADPDARHHGYFMFVRDGTPVAGAMGDLPGIPASDTWTTYFACRDVAAAAAAAERAGARVLAPPMPVDDLGVQAVLVDPAGATFGLWQAGTFGGFAAVGEPGAPSWFELHTRDYARALDFYGSGLGWELDTVSDAESFRSSVQRDPVTGEELAGIMDAAGFRPEGESSRWSVYWEVADVDAAVAEVVGRGGSLRHGPDDTPYGRLAAVTDPAGAPFELRRSPA